MPDNAYETDHAPLLELPTSVAVAEVARARLDEASKALARLAGRKDTEALHDFRVAIRRLRSQLRAFRPWLGNVARRRHRRRLGRLGSATNVARDAEVQLAWLEQSRTLLSRGERSGLNWLARRLRASRRVAYSAARRKVRRDFEQIAASIRDALMEVSPDTPPLAQSVSRLLIEHTDELQSRLAAVRTAADRRAVHESRICAKRLRYLLEPLRSEAPAAKPLVRSFRQLQTLLGNLHDIHVVEATLESALDDASHEKALRLRDLALAGERSGLQRERRRDERFGIASLTALARAERNRLFAELEKRWLGARLVALFADARSFADSLDASGHDAGWKPAVERERKYLLRELPDHVRGMPALEIEQGWLPGQTLRERVRRVRDDNGERYYRTIKVGSGIERIEIEEEADAEVFEAFWPLTSGCRVAKRRYCIPEGARVWEVDEFTDRDLVLAEIELEERDEEVSPPDWLSDVIVREVTDEPGYLNLSLAMQSSTPTRASSSQNPPTTTASAPE